MASQYFVEPPFTAMTAASILGYVFTSELGFSSLARDSQVDLGLDFDRVVLTHEYASI